MIDIQALLTQGDQALTLPMWLELASVMVGGLGGAMVAARRKLDLIGSVALAFLCGLGGGLIRDMIMQVGDVYMLNYTPAVICVIAVGVFVFLFPNVFERIPEGIEWVDIFAVALFSACGVNKAIMYDLGGIQCVLMGVLTGVGGGMMRDVFMGDVPHIFQSSNFYALCAVGGSLSYYVLFVYCNVMNPWVAIVSCAVTIGMRRASLHFDIVSPTGVDLGPRVARAAKRATTMDRTK